MSTFSFRRRLHCLLAATMTMIVAGCGSTALSPLATPRIAESPTPDVTPALCQPSDPSCIGPLAPGIHTTANLLTPVKFEVPDGWSKELDVPGSFQLVSSAIPSGSIGIRPDWAIANQSACTADPEPGVRRKVDDLVRWLVEHPGLITSSPAPVSIGGLDGQVIDLRKDPAWSGPCEGKVSLFTHVGTINDPGWWDVTDSARLRLYFLAAGDERTVTVHVETGDEASFEAFVEAAQPIVESFDFGSSP